MTYEEFLYAIRDGATVYDDLGTAHIRDSTGLAENIAGVRYYEFYKVNEGSAPYVPTDDELEDFELFGPYTVDWSEVINKSIEELLED